MSDAALANGLYARYPLKGCSRTPYGPPLPAPSDVCTLTFDYDAATNIDLADFAGFTAVFSGLR